ncbi:MAG: hypothetical protein ACI9XO_004741, partial [Paraglaciecola sp.]
GLDKCEVTRGETRFGRFVVGRDGGECEVVGGGFVGVDKGGVNLVRNNLQIYLKFKSNYEKHALFIRIIRNFLWL